MEMFNLLIVFVVMEIHAHKNGYAVGNGGGFLTYKKNILSDRGIGFVDKTNNNQIEKRFDRKSEEICHNPIFCVDTPGT